MIPGVYEFQWELGHLIFVGSFLGVALVIALTVVTALVRTARDLRQGFAGAPGTEPRWSGGSPADSPGPGPSAHCRAAESPDGGAGAPGGTESVAGFRLHLDRHYHIGHVWARPEEDGTVSLGFDDMVDRILGKPDRVELPDPGQRLKRGGPAWRVVVNDVALRALSPLHGEVVATGGPERDWYLKVRPRGGRLEAPGLLRGADARVWMTREVSRLNAHLSGGGVGATLSDGGTQVEELHRSIPWKTRLTILADLLLDA